jgi:predicted GNAT family acetyltransferase
MSLYADYLKERENFEIIENEMSFASYQIQGESLYIKDIYILPELRGQGMATDLADQIVMIGKEKGCKFIIGTVSPKDPEATRNLKVLLAYGFHLFRSTEDLIYFMRDLRWVD